MNVSLSRVRRIGCHEPLRRSDWMLAEYGESRYGKLMIERLGNAIYWTSCIISGLFLLAAAAGAAFGHGPDRIFAIAIFPAIALVAWIIGRACRYALAGT